MHRLTQHESLEIGSIQPSAEDECKSDLLVIRNEWLVEDHYPIDLKDVMNEWLVYGEVQALFIIQE